MSDMHRIKPARADVRLMDPVKGKPIPADGADVDYDASHPTSGRRMAIWWKRRIKDGDAVEVSPDPPPPEPRPVMTNVSRRRTETLSPAPARDDAEE